MKKKRTKRPRKPTVGEEIIKALREFLDELKKQKAQIVVMPPPAPTIIKLPPPDDNPPVVQPWKPTPNVPPYIVTCGEASSVTFPTNQVRWTTFH